MARGDSIPCAGGTFSQLRHVCAFFHDLDAVFQFTLPGVEGELCAKLQKYRGRGSLIFCKKCGRPSGGKDGRGEPGLWGGTTTRTQNTL
jgi:hypothetical protein